VNADRANAILSDLLVAIGLIVLAAFFCWDRLTKQAPITEDTTP
jgi:HAMP domain-containing protein